MIKEPFPEDFLWGTATAAALKAAGIRVCAAIYRWDLRRGPRARL